MVLYYSTKKPRHFCRGYFFLFISTIFHSFLPFGFHSLFYSFVCNFFSSSVGFILCSCFFRLTFVFRLSLGLPVFHFPLSDLRCFRFLSSASVLDSDYSASALPFPFFLFPPHSCFHSARLPLSLLPSSTFSPA